MKDMDGLLIFIMFLVLVVMGMMIAAGFQEEKHQDFLKAHGCQLLTEAPTGRRIYCGKACYRAEEVYVYECSDGTKTEVR